MTELKYLEDTYQFTGEATWIASGDDERGHYSVFDSTIFYPQGGGQPSDQGHVEVNGKRTAITFVQKLDGGEVRHYGDPLEGPTPQRVRMQIDEARRRTNARAHTAGHLIASVVEKEFSSLKGIKGYHFPEGPYVEFAGETGEVPDAARLNEKVAEVVRSAMTVTPQRESGTHRTVAIGGFAPVGCGGTHVRSLGELGSVTVTKVKKKGGNLRVSYSVS